MSETAYHIIDADTHVTEPHDVWTSRVPARWKDKVPHVETNPDTGEETWVVQGQAMISVGSTAPAGWREPYPATPPTYADTHPGSYQPGPRLDYMDRLGVWAQVLYPNVGGFGNQVFLGLGDSELMIECVRAYNDFLLEWSAYDSRRLVPIMATPFWDVEAAAAEIRRCAPLGHRGILFSGEPHTHGLPFLADRHWDPFWEAAREVDLPIHFHIGSGDMASEFSQERTDVESFTASAARGGSKLFLFNGGHLLDLLFSGVPARYPSLRFVSVESGAGWIPFILQSADYQFHTLNVGSERPDLKLLPSEYFRRQVYACCWFEKISPELLEWIGADRIMFETDYPHPTSLYDTEVQQAIDAGLSDLPEAARRRILWENAARLYGIEDPR
ncbi:MAG: amidohydrolase [Proteobacteria bacterium]|nr:amidohydrolase [Pseudomonadota bacterium]